MLCRGIDPTRSAVMMSFRWARGVYGRIRIRSCRSGCERGAGGNISDLLVRLYLLRFASHDELGRCALSEIKCAPCTANLKRYKYTEPLDSKSQHDVRNLCCSPYSSPRYTGSRVQTTRASWFTAARLDRIHMIGIPTERQLAWAALKLLKFTEEQ